MKTKTYTLKDGATHHDGSKLLSGGDKVQLTDRQAIAFADKLVQQSEKVKDKTADPEDNKEPKSEKNSGPPK